MFVGAGRRVSIGFWFGVSSLGAAGLSNCVYWIMSIYGHIAKLD